MRRALVEPSGRVAQVEDRDFPVAPPLVWMDCPDDCKADDRYSGGAFVQPTPAVVRPPSLLAIQIRAMVRRLAFTQAELDAARAELEAERK